MKNWVVVSTCGENVCTYEFEKLEIAWKCFNRKCATREFIGYVAKVDKTAWKRYERQNGECEILCVRSLVAEPIYAKLLDLK